MTHVNVEQVADLPYLMRDIEDSVRDANYQPILQDFQQDIAEGEKAAFDGQHEPGGAAWAPLRPSTIARKGHNRILFETGALMTSLVSLGGPGNINATTERSLLFGTDIPYAIFHDQGTSRMPARPPVGMSEETLDKLCNKIADATVELMKG